MYNRRRLSVAADSSIAMTGSLAQYHFTLLRAKKYRTYSAVPCLCDQETEATEMDILGGAAHLGIDEAMAVVSGSGQGV